MTNTDVRRHERRTTYVTSGARTSVVTGLACRPSFLPSCRLRTPTHQPANVRVPARATRARGGWTNHLRRHPRRHPRPSDGNTMTEPRQYPIDPPRWLRGFTAVILVALFPLSVVNVATGHLATGIFGLTVSALNAAMLLSTPRRERRP